MIIDVHLRVFLLEEIRQISEGLGSETRPSEFKCRSCPPLGVDPWKT